MPTRILVAPLHWGLGHATRCIPIIRHLLKLGAEVVLASDGDALRLLQLEFPACESIELPSYNISYATRNMVWNMATQLPHILKTMRLERQKLADIIHRYKINAFISDNRYGLYDERIPSVFLTHQLHLRMPLGIQAVARRVNYQLIQRYTECWIPDVEKESESLAGALSHGVAPLRNAVYIGNLSRLEYCQTSIKYDVLILLSGVEPQRTRLETLLIRQAKSLPQYKFLLIQGKTAHWQRQTIAPNIEVQTYAAAAELSILLAQSRIIVARSGYSTLMDLQKLGIRQAILIPTVGQTEQEYLAERLAAQRIYYSASQSKFDLAEAIAQMPMYTGFEPLAEQPIFERVVEKFLQRL